MILQTDTADLIQDREARIKAIEKIEKTKGRSERWRAIQKLMFDISPWLREDDIVHQEAVKELRLKQLSRTGASKTGDFRSLYSMPEYLYRALQTLDPEFQAMQSSNDQMSVKRFNRAIWAAFPEYRLAIKV